MIATIDRARRWGYPEQRDLTDRQSKRGIFMTKVKLAFDERGRGLPVLLIHGFPLCREMWREQAGALADAGCRVLCPDLPGFGDSRAVGGVPAIAAYTEALIGLLDDLGIDRAVVGGMSMGGYVLFDLALRYPERLHAALFLVTRAAADDAAGRARRTTMAEAVEAGDGAIVSDTFSQLLFAPETPQQRPQLVETVQRWMAGASPEGVAFALRAMRDRDDCLARLSEITLPSLVLGAERDQAIPPQHAEMLAAGLPDAHFAIVPAAGHMANLEQPTVFNRVLLDFINQLAVRDSDA
jgi:pimeloyl-ACP methyl ester carboxylesterase